MPRARVKEERWDEDVRTAPARAVPPLQAHVAELQRSAGNRAVAQLIARNGDGATATATAARPPRLVRRKEVDREVEETISHAPAAFSAWEGTYAGARSGGSSSTCAPRPPSSTSRCACSRPPPRPPSAAGPAELLPDGAPRGRHRLRFAAGAPPLEGAWSGRIESPRVELRS